jgi:hypothetical protein
MFHELRENRLATVHPSLSAMYGEKLRQLSGAIFGQKSSNGKIFKTELTRQISDLWRELEIHLPDSSGSTQSINWAGRRTTRRMCRPANSTKIPRFGGLLPE